MKKIILAAAYVVAGVAAFVNREKIADVIRK